MFSGIVKRWVPRYCPVVRDKIVRLRTQGTPPFLEPEGRDTEEFMRKGCQLVCQKMCRKDLVHSIKV